MGSTVVKNLIQLLMSPIGATLVFAGLGLVLFQFYRFPRVPGGDETVSFIEFGLLVTGLAASFLGLFRWNRRAIAKVDFAEKLELPLTFFDTMTGLPNKMLFQDKVSALLSSGQEGAIFILDLADFGAVNDRRGRAFGDIVIKELGHRLRVWAETDGGFAARLSGDRFGMFLSNLCQAEIDATCAALIALCNEPVIKAGEATEPQVSIGALDTRILGELRALGCDTVLSLCNFSLANAKADGGGSYRIYTKAMEAQFVDLDAMAVALPEALKASDLEVFLQPRCCLKDRSLTGFEALVRWKRDGRYVEAGDLISMAEETGLIYALDQYVIDRTVQTVADWNRRRKTDFSVSVNLSALHLRADKGVEFILDSLQRHQFAPELLTVEVTETAKLTILTDLKSLSALQAVGCRISIDDFGTGYASLERLRILPADEIKLDRKLISELTDSDEARFILDAVLTLACGLGMDVVAEGIEDESQLKVLTEKGCLYGQGYILGHPRPALDWLADATYGPSGEAPAA
jgi:diguanylate cyclase (GGDEF)-like protein